VSVGGGEDQNCLGLFAQRMIRQKNIRLCDIYHFHPPQISFITHTFVLSLITNFGLDLFQPFFL
jgi:hypothetical protein